MVNADGRLCFHDNYQVGLDVLILVRGQQKTTWRAASARPAG
jgi:hypothetical protein